MADGFNYPVDTRIQQLDAESDLTDWYVALVKASTNPGAIKATDFIAQVEALLIPIGSWYGFIGANTPDRWVRCEGGEILRSTKLGTFLVDEGLPYGVGNGTTTVDLPDWRLHSPNGVYVPNSWEIGSSYDNFLADVPLLEHNHSYALRQAEYLRVLESGGVQREIVVNDVAPGSANTANSGDTTPQINTFHPCFATYFIMYAGEDIEVL